MRRNRTGPRVRRVVRVKLPTERPISTERPIAVMPIHCQSLGNESDIVFDGEGQELREVVKARIIAKTVCITLPKELREALGIGANDRVMVQLDKAERRLIVTKE